MNERLKNLNYVNSFFKVFYNNIKKVNPPDDIMEKVIDVNEYLVMEILKEERKQNDPNSTMD